MGALQDSKFVLRRAKHCVKHCRNQKDKPVQLFHRQAQSPIRPQVPPPYTPMVNKHIGTTKLNSQPQKNGLRPKLNSLITKTVSLNSKPQTPPGTLFGTFLTRILTETLSKAFHESLQQPRALNDEDRWKVHQLVIILKRGSGEAIQQGFRVYRVLGCFRA